MFQRGLYAYIFSALGLFLIFLFLALGIVADSFLGSNAIRESAEELERAAWQASVQLGVKDAPLDRLVGEMGKISGFRFTVIARNGSVLADSAANAGSMDSHLLRPEVAAALQGQVGVDKRKSASLGVETLYVAIPSDPVIRAARPYSGVMELSQGMSHRLLTAFLPVLIAGMALSFFLARPLVSRLNAMERFSIALAEGDYETPLEISGAGEMGGLERSLEALRLRIKGLVSTLSSDQKKLASIIDGVPDGLLLFGAGGRLSAANSTARNILRIPEKTGEPLRKEEVVREPRILAVLDAALSSSSPPAEPIQLSWRDPEMELEILCRPMEEEEGRRGALLVLRDVTRQARLERIRTDFIANMAHELFTPLTAIRGASETLIGSSSAKDDQTSKFLDAIHRHSIRLSSIVADVSQLSRIESGASPVVAAFMDARRPAYDVAALFSPEAEKAGVTLAVEAPAEPVNIVSDAEKIESILVNLTQNGVRYTPSGGSVRVSVVHRPGGGVIYQVADTGVGVPFKDIPRITERFYRVDPSRSRAKGGTGLGLSIVKHLVNTLGGRMTIESQLGQGTAVVVELPTMEASGEKETLR